MPNFFDLLFPLFMATAMLMFFEHLNYIAKPGTWVYVKGFPVKKVTIPVLDKDHWLTFLEGCKFLGGAVDEKANKVYLRRPRGILPWWYNPFLGQISLSEPDILIVKFSPVTAINWSIWVLMAFGLSVSTYEFEGLMGSLISFLGAVVIWVTVVYGHYWFFTSNAVDSIQTYASRSKMKTLSSPTPHSPPGLG